LCEEAAREGNANLRPDAAAGALLCEGAARACMNLVAVNLRVGGDDERMKALDEVAEDVRRAGRRVLGPAEG
jgi:formiminotetrahydrofolate cyclodeaminase